MRSWSWPARAFVLVMLLFVALSTKCVVDQYRTEHRRVVFERSTSPDGTWSIETAAQHTGWMSVTLEAVILDASGQVVGRRDLEFYDMEHDIGDSDKHVNWHGDMAVVRERVIRKADYFPAENR